MNKTKKMILGLGTLALVLGISGVISSSAKAYGFNGNYNTIEAQQNGQGFGFMGYSRGQGMMNGFGGGYSNQGQGMMNGFGGGYSNQGQGMMNGFGGGYNRGYHMNF